MRGHRRGRGVAKHSNPKICCTFFWLHISNPSSTVAIFGQKILQDTYLEMAPNFFQLTRVDVRRLRFSLEVHSKFQKILNLVFSNTSKQELGKSFWRWKPLQTRCVMAPNFVEQHRMTSDRDFRDPTILPQVTTIQYFTIGTYPIASRIDVLGTMQGSVSDRKA